MTRTDELRAAGTSPAAIEHHYDLSDEFFRLWLGDELVYSCARWDDCDPLDTLARAQHRKLDHLAGQLAVAGGHVLDIGCGWGALLDRFARVHGLAGGVGITLSPAQARHALGRDVFGVDYRVESWVDHQPAAPYDAITCIEMTEHLASDALSPDEKVDVYAAFFARCGSWLVDGGAMGLQLICLDEVGHERSRGSRSPTGDLILRDIFPESMPGSLSELLAGWETHFRVESFEEHTDHYRRTFRAWALAARAAAATAERLVGPDVARTFARYFAAGEMCFRLREHALYRVVLRKRPQPKVWVAPVRPSQLDEPAGTEGAAPLPLPARPPASPAAIRAHYDLSNEFYELWLGPTLAYSSGWWNDGDASDDVVTTGARKLDAFAALLRVDTDAPSCVLDIGCGWGANLRRLVAHHGIDRAVGLTLSPAQRDFVAAHPEAVHGIEVRVESWVDHRPDALYDAITTYGAFEHVARDGSTGLERIRAYRAFFARCFAWLVPGGRLAFESITHDDAPDTDAALGRGPLGDSVLAVYPESLCPHLSEVVRGFEPWFEVELLRCDGPDFARTMRAWSLGLRRREGAAIALVGASTYRQWRSYLAASEVQFRMGTITNLRLVLRRRPAVRS